MTNDRKFFLFTVIIFLFLGFHEPVLAQTTDVQKGQASWYGSKYHGRKTSSGERYNKNHMTAAHQTLPFGTKVKVTNLDNQESVIVRINDRGPFVGNRIIDVSEVAARKLDFHREGIGQVKVEVLELPGDYNPANAGFYTIQTGSYFDLEHAQTLSQRLKAFDKHLPVELQEQQLGNKKVLRIRAGRFENRQQAQAFNDLLKEEGLQGLVKEA
ncbi:septal ring lytic transglycosylase RlpA family protein [Pontibacter arcticus]|uniref:Probable endolytic peptidoglycan transglycosylase RlpA n=1 Tax=Pontibacter arcticus TaxID=2080288 RepID=A0A364RJ80_9BACT|nr:septal ring lytic transglycosylase RlpA family protein [Pontibacter arcticus]RAU84359.1 septal ring lytic transglycosylase RlpA family protein [Pontibacter arcticus]